MKCSHSRGVTPPTLICRPRRISCPTSVTHDGVIDVVVGRVAGCDILKREPGSKANDTGVARFERSVGSIVHRPKLANERFNDDLRWIEHRDNLVVPNFAEAWHCVAQPKVGVCSLDTLYCGLKT